MKLSNLKKKNGGFSLVELIVVIAIMTVTIGAVTLSVGLVTGSDAKEACRKFNAQIDEVRTGSMSRIDEDLTIKFMSKGEEADIDADGFYTVKEITTLAEDRTAIDPADTSKVGIPKTLILGSEHRYLSRDRVNIVVGYDDGGTETTFTVSKNVTTTSGSFTIKYDRATGLIKGIELNGSEVTGAQLKYIDFEAGLRSYRIEFVQDTGKHTVGNVTS